MRKDNHKILYSFLFCIVLLFILSTIPFIKIIFSPSPPEKKQATVPPPLDYIPQFVLISFDGSKSVDIWKDIRLFKEEINSKQSDSKQKRLNFTHFINAAYFLTDDTKNIYKGPDKAIGKSNIGVSEDIEHIKTRIFEINQALADGDEIAPHTVGHFSGKDWTKDQWMEELASFDRIIFGLDMIYPDAHLPELNLSRNDIVGFRAPYLDKSPGLYDALREKHFLYDTSEIGTGDDWPTKDANGLWHIPLGIIFIGDRKTKILAMDYNIFMRDTQVKNILKKGTSAWNKVHDETLAAFMEYFNKSYKGNRAPVLMGYHFQNWNDGVYWEVMKDFAREVCGKPEVRCATFQELVKYMEMNGVPKK